MLGDRGESSRALVVLIAVLAVALVVVMYFWMQDRESQDVQIELGGSVELLGDSA